MAATTKAAKSAPVVDTGEPLVFDFTMEKTTPGTVRFQQDKEPGQRPAIGTLYITKDALKPLGNFNRIRVTVETID